MYPPEDAETRRSARQGGKIIEIKSKGGRASVAKAGKRRTPIRSYLAHVTTCIRGICVLMRHNGDGGLHVSRGGTPRQTSPTFLFELS